MNAYPVTHKSTACAGAEVSCMTPGRSEAMEWIERAQRRAGICAQPPRALELLARNMRALRRCRGMSQEELGRSTGMHRTLVAHIESCRRNIRLDTLERIAEGLQVSPGRLLEASICELASRMQRSVDVRRTLASNILELRRAKGMDTGTLATRCGIAPTLMSGLESQKANVTVPTVEKLALALSVPIGHLFKDDKFVSHRLSTSAESVPWIGGKPLAAAFT
jgi:transcriptional regulator with XRE-family HTH domain